MTQDEGLKDWVIAQVMTQDGANRMLPDLMRCKPNKGRGIVIWPMCGPVDLCNVWDGEYRTLDVLRCRFNGDPPRSWLAEFPDDIGVKWVTVSGGRKPLHPDWVRKIRDQCIAAGAKFSFVGWGEWALKGSVDAHEAPSSDYGVLAPDGTWYHGHTGWNGRPIDPDTNEAYMLKVGAKASGKMLDGREWDERPELM